MEKCDWFKNWFDSPYYHILYKNRDVAEAEYFLSRLITFLKVKKNHRILDLGCGKGRHSIYLNKLGYDVCGFDLSQASITEAKKSENNTLRFFVHDMRNPFPFRFECILSLFTSFGYFEDEKTDIMVLHNITESLEKNGIFVLDFFNTEKVRKMKPYKGVQIIDNIEFNISKTVENNRIIKKINVKDGDKTFDFEESVRLLDARWLSGQLKEMGYRIDHLLGDYALHPYSLESDRMILIATKK